MKWILITPEYFHKDEFEIIENAYSLGVERIHIRKPNIALKEFDHYMEQYPEKCLSISSLHYYDTWLANYNIDSFHLSEQQRSKYIEDDSFNSLHEKNLSTSFHDPIDFEKFNASFSYSFCSPIFRSISKKNYFPNHNWNVKELKNKLTYALGGIHSGNINECKEKGFDGIAVLGTVWNKNTMKESIQELIKIKEICKNLS